MPSRALAGLSLALGLSARKSNSLSQSTPLPRSPSAPAMPPAQLQPAREGWATDLPSTLLRRNQLFVAKSDPSALALHAHAQAPSVFWLGCSDSRVSEAIVVQAEMGQVFVHRNVANLYHSSDTSAAAALAFAINSLKVPHVVVVGHEACGGCAAALQAALDAASSSPPAPPAPDSGQAALVRWIDPIRQIALSELEQNPDLSLSQLVAANVRAQVQNLVDCPIIQNAWARSQPLTVHGWVYDTASGQMSDLGITHSAPKE